MNLDYNEQGKFELEIGNKEDIMKKFNNNELKIFSIEFDTSTILGSQAMVEMLVYKHLPNMNCITEDYIEKKKFRKQEKIDMLKSMLNSEVGLFEITETLREDGQVKIKNVITGKEYCITDIGLSSNLHNDTVYIYTRIITYDGVSFGTGLNIIFKKDNSFIMRWILKNKKDSDKDKELVRFLELYSEAKKDK